MYPVSRASLIFSKKEQSGLATRVKHMCDTVAKFTFSVTFSRFGLRLEDFGNL